MPLSPRMPDLTSLEVLLAIADRGSLSAAGREVGLTQQAVSARIASLEAQTGVNLVMRSTRGSQLTASGLVAAQWAGRLLQVAHEVDAGLASLRESSRSRVKVSASLTVAEQLLPGWLVSLQAAARHRGQPPVEVVLTATNTDHVLAHVRSGQADVGFVEGPRVPHGLRSRVVAHDELVLVVRPDHPWARRPEPVTAPELNETALVTREPGSGTRDFLTMALRKRLGPGRPRPWRCRPPPPSGRPCWPGRPRPSSAGWRWPTTSRPGACTWCRSRTSACAAPCARSGSAAGPRPRERYAT